MFGNFIYFIIALIIYSSYQPSYELALSFKKQFSLFLIFTLFFFCFTKFVFFKLEKMIFSPVNQSDPISRKHLAALEYKFNTLLTRQSVIAIALFAIDIYWLNLSVFIVQTPFFSKIPTIGALIFILLFVFYLSIVWGCAYRSYMFFNMTDISRWSYILSNISFSIPVILPWLIFSICFDIINTLPFELPQKLLSTPEGEAAYFLLFLITVAMIGPAIIQKVWRCSPLETGYYRERIEKLCKRSGLKYANILYWPIFGGRMITAGVMGLTKKFRYILVTKAMIRLLDPEEIDAVISHEIGHIKKKHLLFYLLFFIGYMLLSYALLDIMVYAIVYTKPLYKLISSAGYNQASVMPSIFSIGIVLIFIVYFRYIFGYFMRNFERQADTYVYKLLKNAKPLIKTFEKIAKFSGQAYDKPNWHHFSIKERIDYLKKCETDKIWITNHERKIKKSITVYLAGIIFIAVIGYQLSFGTIGRKLNNNFIERIILYELEENKNSHDLYEILGDLYYVKSDFEKTIKAYERSLAINPDNPEVLNNLAWLYATCKNRAYQDHEKALILSKKAVKLMTAPHILDTLAESYYVNEMYKEAVLTEKKAIKIAKKDNKAYYEKQLKKFMTAP